MIYKEISKLYQVDIVTINSNGIQIENATVHRMQTLGSMIGERINIQNLDPDKLSSQFHNTS